ncbi:MAG: AAA domain-containing protein [Bacteroidota bacterium]
MPANITEILQTYIRRLTNLAGNNRMLYLPRIASDQFLDVHELSQLNKEKSFEIIEALIRGTRKVLCPVVDSRMEASNEASKKLKKLLRQDHFLFEERGTKDLHIGWPFVHGKFSDGTFVRCPLLFFPVELAVEKAPAARLPDGQGQSGDQWVIRLREDATLSFNKSFLLAYALYNSVKVDETLLEEDFEEFDNDSNLFRTSLYHLLQSSRLDIHFNPDNYRDELTFFTNFKKEEFDQQHGNGQLKLYPEAVLGIFPQAGSFLVPDYLNLIDQNKITSFEEFFSKRCTAEPLLDIPSQNSNFISLIKEEKIVTGLLLDAWQENALKATKLGHSLVVQGPPGTGKSHLICNLISDCIATGKSVLVVCQKRAALDVVYQRLKEQGLSDFIALVHDFKNDRNEIYQKATAQIERVNEYKTRNTSLDTIQLERKFFHASRRIDQITEELEEFKSALFDEQECGISVKELYLRSYPKEETINLKQEYQHFKIETVDEFLPKLRSFMHYASRFETASYPLHNRKSFADFTSEDRKAIKSILEEIPLLLKKLTSVLSSILSATPDWQQNETLWEKESDVKEVFRLLSERPAYAYFQRMTEENDDETSSLWLSNIKRVVNDCFLNDGPEISTPAGQLGIFQKMLSRSMKARRNIIGLVRWELFSEDKYLIKRILVNNGLKSNKAGFQMLERKLDSRLNLEHNLSKLKSKPWLLDFPEDYNQQTIEGWFDIQLNALKAKLIFNSIRGIKIYIDPKNLSEKEFREKLEYLYGQLSVFIPQKEKWANHLSTPQIDQLTSNSSQSELLQALLAQDFDALCEYDRLKVNLSADEQSVINKLKGKTETWDFEIAKSIFTNSLFQAWVDHIETKHPILRIVSSGKLDLLEHELREQITEKQTVSAEIILLRARERVVEDLAFNRLNNRVTYRDLHHQVTKKKKIWPIRKVVSEFEVELFRILPCWLASPESVSAIFPMKEMFDLVIFDEASQCFAERGIPSMYRGKQILVAGDSQQLRPSDLYQLRWQEEDTEEPDLEIDSLLELSERYLQHVQLNGHYRSKSPALIDFSNHHFYGGHLNLLPDANVLNQPEPAIEYLKTNGVWENNTNVAEAEQIANLVLNINKQHPQKEIGIITFNAPQQTIVLDKLEEIFSLHSGGLPETLFVKNIENVQGDEKDIIIFSIGYAPDPKGKINMQFGSLNMAGGENRLNVAITRAREKIYIVTSIWPEELRVEESKNQGPKLLKLYLQYAREVSEQKVKPFDIKNSKHHPDWYLKTKIKDQCDYEEAELQIASMPFADLVVKKARLPALPALPAGRRTTREDGPDGQKNQFYGLILTDDDLYYHSISVKDPHALLPLLLEQKNWKHTMLYSRSYWQDPDKFFNEVAKFVTQ